MVNEAVEYLKVTKPELLLISLAADEDYSFMAIYIFLSMQKMALV